MRVEVETYGIDERQPNARRSLGGKAMRALLERRGILKHKHCFEWAEDVWSGPALVARVERCSCGKERRELTPAGYQHLYASPGLTADDIAHGRHPYPYPLTRTMR